MNAVAFLANLYYNDCNKALEVFLTSGGDNMATDVMLYQTGKDEMHHTWHKNQQSCFLYVHSGKGIIAFSNRIYSIERGSLLYIPHSRYHYTLPEKPEQYIRSKMFVSNKQIADFASKTVLPVSSPAYAKIPQSEQNQIENITQEMQTKMAEIETIENKQEYFLAYKNIVSEYSEWFDAPETIYNYYTSEEVDLLFRVVQAEIGNYSFEQKCNVVSVIFNRLNNEIFPNTMSEILVANQFCTIRNGSIHKVTVDETTILACEYVFMFGDPTGGALFFDSNGALNYKFIFHDGAHNFYTTHK